MMLPWETLDGIRITGKVKVIFTEYILHVVITVSSFVELTVLENPWRL